MKVTQGVVTKFEPVTILLETEEEADLMWCLFDKGDQLSMERFMKEYHYYSFKDWRGLRWKMSEKYRAHYKPNKEDC